MRKRSGEYRIEKMLYQDERNVRKGKWTAEEDALLAAYIAKHGEGKWKMVRKRAGINRSAQSCRLRWTSHLHSSLKKGPLTPEEELTILELHEQMGNKWARIALQLPGRTDTGIKNYVNALIRKGERAREKAAQRSSSPGKDSLPQLHKDPEETAPRFSTYSHYRPNAGKLSGSGIPNQPGADNWSTVVTDGLSVNGMTELLNHLGILSSPNGPLEQPHYTNSIMEKVYQNDQGMDMNYNYLGPPGDDHLRMSVNNMDGNIQVPSISTDTSVISSAVSPWPSPPLPQDIRAVVQYNCDANQRYLGDSAHPIASWCSSSQRDMSHLQLVCSPEPRNFVQTAPYNRHPGNFGEIIPYNVGPSEGNFTPVSPESPYVYTGPSFQNYGASHTHAEQSLQVYVPSQNSSWK